MKIFYYLFICSLALLLTAGRVSSQTMTRHTTKDLLSKARASGFDSNDPSPELNIAIPLIDSLTALSLTKIGDTSMNNFFNYAISLQWLNKADLSEREFPGVPADMFYCDGYAGQDIYIIPSKKLVVVRLGLTLDHSFNENAFLKEIIEAINTR